MRRRIKYSIRELIAVPYFPNTHLTVPGGGEGLLKTFLYGEASPRDPTPYPLYIIFGRKDTPFVYLPLENSTPFTNLLKNTASPF